MAVQRSIAQPCGLGDVADAGAFEPADLERLGPSGRGVHDVDRVSGFGEGASDNVRNANVVLHDKELHAKALCTRSVCGIPSTRSLRGGGGGHRTDIGRTGNLSARVEAHLACSSVHTANYKIRTLVWFETHEDFATSLQRERAIKRWPRAWKNALIAERNPNWQDITAHIPV